MERSTTSKLSIDESDIDKARNIPSCSHGKALKFNRLDKKSGITREFYACSSSRDRKVCSLFYWVDDWARKLKSGSAIVRDLSQARPPREKKARVDADLGLSALTDNSTNAQFLFDSNSIDLIIRILVRYFESNNTYVKKVLCIGTPSVHKRLLELNGFDSVLLDDDDRLGSILANFRRFNMFNGNLYGNETSSLDDDFRVVVIDPPFHPELLPALFKSIERIFPCSLKSSLVLFAFPYFHKVRLESASRGLLQITDIRMTYRNHKKYKTEHRSPVRLFTSCHDFLEQFLSSSTLSRKPES